MSLVMVVIEAASEAIVQGRALVVVCRWQCLFYDFMIVGSILAEGDGFTEPGKTISSAF